MAATQKLPSRTGILIRALIILFVGLHIRLSLSVPMSEDLCGNYIPATAHVLTGMPKMRVVWALAQQR